MAKSLTSGNKTKTDCSNNRPSIAGNIENKESTTLLWFDPNIGSREDTEQTKQQLRHINDYVIFHTDLEQCVTFIQSINHEKIFLITSGSKASQLLPRVFSLRPVDSIFIFCMKKERYEHLLKEYAKIIGIYVDLDELCQAIREQIDLVDKQLQTFSFFDQHQKSTKNLSDESAAFLWFQLFHFVIAQLPRNEQAKKQMIEMCKHYYYGNSKELTLIDQFAQEYQSKEAIRWYSKQSFVYKLVNKALRTEDVDLLYTFRFFVGDLTEALRHEHQKLLLFKEEILTVYRGLKLDEEEFDKLNENQGKLISTNGYLSTSRLRSNALAFAMKQTRRTDVIPVLFEIKCNVKMVDKSVVFGDIRRFSDYPEEEEVLFDLNACFQIESIERDGLIQVIKMNVSNEGENITKSFITQTQKEAEEQSVVIVFGRLMCNLGEYDKSQKYFEQLLKDPNGEDIAWIEFNIGRALDFKGHLKEARENYDRAYDRMMDAKPARTKDSAYVLNNIGVNLADQGKYDEALDYHRRALKIREKYYSSGHADIAISLRYIGDILSDQKTFHEALDYHHRALKMQEKYYPSASGHIDIARTLQSIGDALEGQGKYKKALDYLQRALEMRETFFPSGHIQVAHSLYSIGLCFEHQSKTEIALEYYYRALTLYERFLPVGHSCRINTEGSIRRLTRKQVTLVAKTHLTLD